VPSLPSIPHMSREVLVAIGVVVALLALWIWARYGRRRYVEIRKSGAIDDVSYQLGRIADALERLAVLASPRDSSQPPAEAKPQPRPRPRQQENWLSQFRR
jgi:hypothetical protein